MSCRRPTTSSSSSRWLGKLAALPEALGTPQTLLADSGYFSAANVEACTAAGIEPLIALGRQSHHPSWRERFAAAPPAPDNPTPVEAMAHRLATPEGKKLYALRKQTPEPVFGIIKSVLGFRQFSLRGLDKVRGEWSLVTLAWNIKRMFALKAARQAADRALLRNPGATDTSFHQDNTRKRRSIDRSGFFCRTNRCRASTANLQSDRLLGRAIGTLLRHSREALYEF